VINLGNPRERTILQHAALILELTHSTSDVVFAPPVVGDDPQRRQPSIDKAQILLGWKPRISLREGLKQTISYFQKENVGQVGDADVSGAMQVGDSVGHL
jgi:nucleoside-diphosphate-sugar epimerase